MNHFLSIVATAVCVSLFGLGYWLLIRNYGQPRKIKQPPLNNPTMFDVRRLLQEGDKEKAILYYSRIFKVSSKQARKDIAELERSLKV